MVRLDGTRPLGLIPLLAFSISPVSAIIIDVVTSGLAEVWREGDGEALRRKDPEPLELRLCRPPTDKPWLGVFAIDPRETTCQNEGGSSPSWDFAEIEYEGGPFVPVPGTLLQLQGPTGVAITNTNDPEEFLTYGAPENVNLRQRFETSKFLVEKFGNNGNFERLSKTNPLQEGYTLRLWEEGLPVGFRQLYLRNVVGNPKRLTRARPPIDQDINEDFAAAVERIQKEYPYAELRIASMGNTEIVGPGIPTTGRRVLNKISTGGKALFSFIKNRGKPGLEMNRVRIPSGELNDDDFEVVWNEVEGVPDQQRFNIDPEFVPVVQQGQGQGRRAVDFSFEESKEDYDERGINRVEEIPLRPIQNINANPGIAGQARPNVAVNRIGDEIERESTIYQTAFSHADEDEENRLGDIIDYNPDEANNKI
ncbi:hypothetical protein Dda_1443 [Drechslerella dactyloides]|uniref:Uncharacterized protein n=1 Tax=Drechslerella dactyloides TaxID=74499 RepID=A0AAD6NKM4_DREDA|nr:hypothetical protein Dda_1443 [Drechslerella dactyloides]